MRANGINVVAVGLEQLGAQDFVEGKFFDGEVYIDEGKKTYRDLNYRRFNIINIWKSLMSRISRAAANEAKGRGIAWNFSGDGLQNGGMLIVTKGGTRVLLNHREDVPGDHMANDDILKILEVTEVEPRPGPQQDLESQPPCQEDCQIP